MKLMILQKKNEPMQQDMLEIENKKILKIDSVSVML